MNTREREKEQKESEGYTNEWLYWGRQREEEEKREESRDEERRGRLGREWASVKGCLKKDGLL